MFHSHSHDHDHHHHEMPAGPAGKRRLLVAMRFGIAALILVAAGFTSASVMVGAGQAVVVTRFGDLSRVLAEPGLAWKLPAPVESTISVDLRLRTSSTGLQDVGTKDGLRILVQAYVAWRVPAEAGAIRQFVRSVRNDPDEAVLQIRSLVGAALQTTASGFELADLVDTEPARQLLPQFEARLRDQVGPHLLEVYGVSVEQVGIERLTLPDATLAATVARMRAERETVAAARTAEGLRAAAELRAGASRDARVTVARARTEAADIEAASRQEAAGVQARAYRIDPELYTLLRSMDTLGSVVGPNTRMVLRTDAAPFNMLVQGLAAPGAGPGAAPPAPSVSQGQTVGSAR